MLTYTFSRREKVLIAVFAVLLLAVGWYQLVYVTTTNQMNSLDAELENVEQEIAAAQVKLAKKQEMERVIRQKMAEGAKTTPIPTYDNIKPLMTELDTIMAMTDNYSLTFEPIDIESSDYILRGVNMHFEVDTYEVAEEMIRAVAEGSYPCIIDSVSISSDATPDSLKGLHSDVKASIHVVFYEHHPHSHRG